MESFTSPESFKWERSLYLCPETCSNVYMQTQYVCVVVHIHLHEHTDVLTHTRAHTYTHQIIVLDPKVFQDVFGTECKLLRVARELWVTSCFI